MNIRHPVAQAVMVALSQIAASHVLAATSDLPLSGTITDALGKPVANAQISVRSSTGSQAGTARTGPDGHFLVEHVAPGTYAVVVSAPGFDSGNSIATVASGQPNAITLALKKQEAIDVQVNAARLDQARNGLSPETGSSVYRITQENIEAMPQGRDASLNQVLLQAPGVANDSYGQLHVRGDHADLQYRINGITIPESIGGFGQSLDTRIIKQVNLLTGALPAQYGYRTAGIVDIQTKSGGTDSGGSIDLYGGSHGTLQSSADVYGNKGAFSYYFSGSLGENNLGIESPTPTSNPLHDHTHQDNGFGYMSYLIDPLTRISLMFGTSTNQFELPNTPGLPTNFTLNGNSNFNSSNLNETQSELTNFATLALQGTDGDKLDYQIALSTRYTRTQFNPDPVGDLLFNGVASKDFHNNTANSLQADTTYRLNDAHTLRAGIFYQNEQAKFNDTVSVFPADANGNQLSDQATSISDSSQKSGSLYSAYVQDEWKITDKLTANYGLRFDGMDEYVQAGQVSPRLGLVYKLTPATTLHAAYARYFTPPSFELVSGSTISRFNGTTNQSAVTQNDPVQPERDNYVDVGVTQRVSQSVTVGLDGYYKKASELLDLGQFGSALIYTPFNYASGQVFGTEFTADYKKDHFSSYFNIAYSRATGEDVNSAQFNFDPDELAYIADHKVFLDHDQRITASFGAAYSLGQTTFTANGIIGSGLRNGFANTEKLPGYAQVNLGVIEHFNEPAVGKFDARLVVMNVFGRVYELRDGTGIGVGAPQFGPERGVFAGVTKYF